MSTTANVSSTAVISFLVSIQVLLDRRTQSGARSRASPTSSQMLAPVEQARPEEIIQLRDRLDLLHGRIDVVRQPDVLDRLVGHHHKAAPRVAIARLTDRPDIYDRLLVGDFKL